MKANAQTKIAFWQRRYRPRVGLLRPNDRVALAVSPDIRGDERPVVVTPRPGDVLIADVTPVQVTVENRTDRSVPFLLVVVPVNMVAVGMIPWREVVRRAPEIVKRIKATDVLQVLMAAMMRPEVSK